MNYDTDWQAERGYTEARNLLVEIADHMMAGGATLKDFAVALNTDMTLSEVKRTWPVVSVRS